MTQKKSTGNDTRSDLPGSPKGPERIEPLSFRPAQKSQKLNSSNFLKWLAGGLFAVVLILLCTGTWFVFTARQMVITIEPAPENLVISGGLLTPRFGNHYLMRPGKYRLEAMKQCFFPLEHNFQVGDEKRQNLNLSMEKLPGRLAIQTFQAGAAENIISDAKVYIDQELVGGTPLESVDVLPGTRRIEIRADKYQDFETDIEVNGCGELQALRLALLPGWSDISVQTIPSAARVKIDGKPAGATPLRIQLAAGTYRLEISAQNFKTWEHRLVVQPNEAMEITDIRLQPADGKLTVKTTPAGANVLVDGTYISQTPLTANLAPSKDHLVQISKAGYKTTTRKVQVASGATRQLAVKLTPIKGVIHLSVNPQGAELIVNGKSWGPAPKQLQLVAVEHTLELRKKGYHPYRTRITPRPGFPQQVKVALQSQGVSPNAAPAEITTKTGYRLKLIRPKTFEMGSSRREQGHRSNEALRRVKLTRPFYMGLTEITNKEFKQFSAQHQSGVFKSQSLGGADRPVVRITWKEAAEFCNWLSRKESLPPAYVVKGKILVAVAPPNTGYRLPTEAEWEYSARFNGKEADLKYPWGSRFPPPPSSGNYADQSAKDLLPTIIEGYNDGYAASAPPAKFKPNPLGVNDMGGNVAEWCHDYYSIYSYSPDKTYTDPVGPPTGKHHVIRGASWKNGGITSLRVAYRRYSVEKQEDVGFRVCRYLK